MTCIVLKEAEQFKESMQNKCKKKKILSGLIFVNVTYITCHSNQNGMKVPASICF